MTRHQEDLDVGTFNAETTVMAKTDFAANAELQAQHTRTCEQPTSASQDVALVIHSPKESVNGKPREVVCDYWRAWSNAKPSSQFHQAVMDEIADHYKIRIPKLDTLKIKSDGCGYQYKGRQNFANLARFHEDHCKGVRQWHDFPASHHYSGPHDNAGKQPRIKMRRDEASGKSRCAPSVLLHLCYDEYCFCNSTGCMTTTCAMSIAPSTCKHRRRPAARQAHGAATASTSGLLSPTALTSTKISMT